MTKTNFYYGLVFLEYVLSEVFEVQNLSRLKFAAKYTITDCQVPRCQDDCLYLLVH